MHSATIPALAEESADPADSFRRLKQEEGRLELSPFGQKEGLPAASVTTNETQTPTKLLIFEAEDLAGQGVGNIMR